MYDNGADILYINLDVHRGVPGAVARTEKQEGGRVSVDYDSEGHVIGVKVLEATVRRIGQTFQTRPRMQT